MAKLKLFYLFYLIKPDSVYTIVNLVLNDRLLSLYNIDIFIK